MSLDRRRFLQVAGAGTGWAVSGAPQAFAEPHGAHPEELDVADTVVRLSGDGLGLTTAQYARLLSRLVDEKGLNPDTFSLGGVVEELEEQFARLLGKERAIFMPTGTLANQLAVRALAGGPSQVLVQEESHFYLDEGDCAQTLSNLTLMPLARGRATFTADDVEQHLERTRTGRVRSRVSVISIETPVRRKQGERFDAAELQRIIAVARREGIRLHLDGARMFMQAAYTGQDVATIARPFDTVYVSLYKYFNATSGAILAGPQDVIDGMYHTRRMFGGGLPGAWPFAAIARHYLDGFAGRYATAVRTSEDLIEGLGRRDRFAIERVSPGTNIFRLRVRQVNPARFRERLADMGVLLPPPQNDLFVIGVNETLNRTTASDLVARFGDALSA